MHLAQHPSSQENDGEVSGTLAFHTSGVPCLSCVGVAAQFKRHYPRVRPLVCWMGWWNTLQGRTRQTGKLGKSSTQKCLLIGDVSFREGTCRKVPVDPGDSFVYRWWQTTQVYRDYSKAREIPINQVSSNEGVFVGLSFLGCWMCRKTLQNLVVYIQLWEMKQRLSISM